MASIAIVEDEISIANLYKLKLELEGFFVKIAHDGSKGLKLIKEMRPDLILLDLHMPHMSGEEMLAKLRETSWGSGIKVIVLTNLSRQEAPTSLRFLDVKRYLVKANHTPAQIVGAVREVLNVSSH